MSPRAPRYVASLAALLCLAACGGAQKDPRPEIASVRFRGNDQVDDDELEDGLATRGPRGWLCWAGLWCKHADFDRRVIDDDKARIRRQYRERGYFDAEVTDVAIDESDPDEVDVEFRITEGEPVVVTDVRFDGAPTEPDVAAAALARIADLDTGRPFDHPAYLEAKQRLLVHLVGRGFAHAEVRGEVLVQPSRRSAVVAFAIDAGPRVTFGPLIVEGLDRVPRSAIVNRVAWKEGDPYQAKLLAATRVRLRTLGFFSTVRVDVDGEGRLARPPVRIVVVEAPLNVVRLGGGVAVDRIRWGLRGLAGYSRLHAAGPLTKLKTELRPGYVVLRDDENTENDSGPVIEARVELSKDDFVLPLVNGLVGGDFSVRQVETYQSYGPTLRTKLSRTFLDGLLYVGLAYQIQQLRFDDVNPAIDDDLRLELGFDDLEDDGAGGLVQVRSPYQLALLEQSVALDGRDDPVRPRLGYYGAVKVQQSAVPLGSEFSFWTAAPEGRGFVPLGDRVVVAALVRWSQLIAGDDLPITRRFFGGGATSHRGFAQRRLSPVARRSVVPGECDMPLANGTCQAERLSVAIGGEAMLESSLEVRVDVASIAGQTLGFVAFVDAGDVTANADQLDPFDVHVAVGGGLRLYTPIGPLRVDLGYRLNRFELGEPDANERLAFHFTLGEAF